MVGLISYDGVVRKIRTQLPARAEAVGFDPWKIGSRADSLAGQHDLESEPH